MAAYCTISFLILFICVAPAGAVRGATDACCRLALKDPSSILPSTSNHTPHYVCGQSYSRDPALSPAPDLKVKYEWCVQHCDGYKLYAAWDTNDWALPLVSFILAAVIFSTAVPRQRALRLRRWRSKNFVSNALAVITDPIVIILDNVVWVFVVMTLPGYFMLSGLVEMTLDYRITRHALGGQHVPRLTQEQQVEILTAVVAGSLKLDVPGVDAQQDLRNRFSQNSSAEETVNSLLSMLNSQGTFGGVVGAAVLLYIGQFGYSLTSLYAMKGDKATARALAFGIWWMTTVHVSVVGATLLAGNNPSTPAAIAGPVPEQLVAGSFREDNGRIIHLKSKALALWGYLFPRVYETPYEPAWMWLRGKNKLLWLGRTSAWYDQERSWFRDLIRISPLSWVLLTAAAFSLFAIPCALAFVIEFETPPINSGCRSMTILTYFMTQVTLLLFSAQSHIKAFNVVARSRRGDMNDRTSKRQRLLQSIFVANILIAFAATFVGTLMQVTGIFQNCWCAANYSFSQKKPSTVSLATDTQADRDSSAPWYAAGILALSVLLIITYAGGLIQRCNRDIFHTRAKSLLDSADSPRLSSVRLLSASPSGSRSAHSDDGHTPPPGAVSPDIELTTVTPQYTHSSNGSVA